MKTRNDTNLTSLAVSQGLYAARMTTATRDATFTVANGKLVNGLIIYNITDDVFNFYQAGAWARLALPGPEFADSTVSVENANKFLRVNNEGTKITPSKTQEIEKCKD